MIEKSKAIRLAEILECGSHQFNNEAANELRCLHAANLDCIAWYEAAKSECDELLTALKKIEAWNSHTLEFSIDYGSSGVRDLYRDIARVAIHKVTCG